MQFDIMAISLASVRPGVFQGLWKSKSGKSVKDVKECKGGTSESAPVRPGIAVPPLATLRRYQPAFLVQEGFNCGRGTDFLEHNIKKCWVLVNAVKLGVAAPRLSARRSHIQFRLYWFFIILLI